METPLAVGMVSGVLGGGRLASRARCAEDTGGAFRGESRPERHLSAGLQGKGNSVHDGQPYPSMDTVVWQGVHTESLPWESLMQP